ncbi:MAG: radical SAM protein [Desulfoferrobacter sp.]
MTQDFIFKSYQALKALMTRKVTIECDSIPYHYQNVPVKKLLNWVSTEASIFFRRKRPWGLPTHLQIEPANLCNLKCALCPIAGGMDRPSGRMSLTMFQNIIDELGDFLYLILLWDWGEPFLNPDIYKMISYAKKRGIKVVSSSNGHIFDSPNQAEKLVESGIDSIIFAVDGICQQTYEQYRRSGSIDTVLSGLNKVVSAKQALKSKTPLINLRFIVMKHNENEIPKLKKLARTLGVDALTLKTLNPHPDAEDHPSKKNDKEFLPQNPLYQRFSYDPVKEVRIRRIHNPCKVLWHNPTIHWDGKVCPCTFDVHDRYILGDLNTQTFRDIWRGEPYKELRERFRRDYRDVELCSKCSYAFEGGSCATEIIAEAHFFTGTDQA